MVMPVGLLGTAVILFVLTTGFLILWRKGRADLEAWGNFVNRIFRGR
jgi:hypothetical protein